MEQGKTLTESVSFVWKLKEAPFHSTESFNLSKPIQQVLFNRGIRTSVEARHFLEASLTQLDDPFLFNGMTQAVARIRQNIKTQKKVLLHGDYDADGITSCAILSKIMEQLHIPYRAFLPHRTTDGYGVSAQAIHQACLEGVDLLITADCGTNAKEEVALAKRLGMDVIVIDHHTIQEQSKAEPDVLLNPILENCHYPFRGFASCGLSFKLGQALLGLEAMKEVMDIAAVGTVSDLAPLQGENRVLVKYGLKKLSENPSVGLKALYQASRLRARKLNASHLGFVFGPRINASGRMGTAEVAYRLLVTTHEKEAHSLAQALDGENKFRQKTEAKMVQEAIRKVKKEFSEDDLGMVVWQEGWHPGVVGIVAARLVDRFYRPALVLAVDEVTGLAKGSGRSVASINLVSALEACQEHLTTFGGHEQAVGLSLTQENLDVFRKRFNEHLKLHSKGETFLKPLWIDAEITLGDLTSKMLTEFDQLEPFGFGNPKPNFLIRRLRLKSKSIFRGDSWTAWVTDGELVYEVIWDKPTHAAKEIKPSDSFDIVFTLKSRSFFGEERLVLDVKDLRQN